MHAGGWLASSQTVGSFIAELGDTASRYWATGTAAPCLSVFRPISVDRPHDVGEPTGKPDESLWWRFESVHRGLLGTDAEKHSAYLQERDRVQAQVFEADEDAAWQTAERWLRDCADDLSRRRAGDHRPRWLRRYWQRVALRASQGSRLPWRLP